MKFKALSIAILCGFVSHLYAAQPRYPKPSTPDQVWQNDLDLLDSIEVVEAAASSGVTVYPATATIVTPFGITSTTATFNNTNSTITLVDIFSSTAGIIKLRTATGHWLIGIDKIDGNSLEISTGTLQSAAVIHLNQAGDVGFGGAAVSPAQWDFFLNSSLTDKPRLYVRNPNGTSGQERKALIGVLGDNGNESVHLRAGKNSSNVSMEMIDGSTSLQLGAGGIEKARVGVTSVSVTVPILAFSGTVASPSYAWAEANSQNSGLYRSATDETSISANGSRKFTVTSSGQVLQPSQPNFLARNTTALNNFTGAGVSRTIPYTTEIFDHDASLTNSTFTAQVDGRYNFSAYITLSSVTVAHTYKSFAIRTSNRNYVFQPEMFQEMVTMPLQLTTYADMDAGDICYVTIEVGGDTQSVDIPSTVEYNGFSGSLIN